MGKIRCFLIEPTGKSRIWWRRYSDSLKSPCRMTNKGYCNGMVLAGDVDGTDHVCRSMAAGEEEPGAQWPTHCERCGREFTPEDAKQVFCLDLYREVGTEGPIFTMRDAPAGAMWFADWLSARGPDGRNLVVMTPGGEWMVDGRASNCTMPQDREHRCWVRHGAAPQITVDKNGKTCAAGAGSIIVGNYHGFLRNGFLEEC